MGKKYSQLLFVSWHAEGSDKMPHYTQSGKGCKFDQQIEVEIGY